MDGNAVYSEVVTLLAEATARPQSELRPDTKLFDGGLQLDSFATVELISQIEEHYDFEFSDEDFLPENFVDLSTLCALVERSLAADGRDAGA